MAKSNDDLLRKIDSYLEQCSHFDKDQRYMATSDISNILTQGVKLDAFMEKKVSDAIVKQFDDTSIDVQSIAVRTVSVLVAKSQQQQVVEICSVLCEKMLKGEEAVRNLYAIGLKTCISNLPDSMGQPVIARILPKLIQFIQNDITTASVQDALEVVNDLVGRFGPEMESNHDTLIKMAIGQLSNPNNLVRKRAIACLGSISAVAADSSLNKMVETLLGRIDGTMPASSPRGSKGKVASADTTNVVQETIVVQAIGAVGRSAGSRLGAHVDKIVPLFHRHLLSPGDSSMQTPAGDDHRENIFQGLDSFVLRCPAEIEPHLPEVFKKAESFLKYDPNYNDDDMEMDDDYDGGSEEDDDYSNFGEEDDDSSWKVRRAAAKVLNSIIVSRPDTLKEYYSRIDTLLQERFRERVESVRLDILEAYKSMLEATVIVSDRPSSIFERPQLVRQRSTGQLLQESMPNLVKNLSRLLKDKNKHAIKTKIASFQVTSKLIYVLGGNGWDEQKVDMITPAIVTALNDKNTNLRLEALVLSKTLLFTLPCITSSHCETLKNPIIKCVQADWFKIVAEALRCISALCTRIRPMDADETMFQEVSGSVDLGKWGSSICEAIIPRLKQTDIDQEIKNCAIDAGGIVLSIFGDFVGIEKEKDMLNLLLERSKNESSRLPALKAIERCAKSPAKLKEFPSVCPQIADELAALLRQQSREIRQHALSTFIALIGPLGFVPSKSTLGIVIVEMGNFVADSKDSHLAHLALTFCALVFVKLGQNGRFAVKEHVSDKIINATFSSATLLTGQAYQSLLNLYQVMSAHGDDAGLGFDDVFPRLFQNDDNFWVSLPKASMHIIAESCAVLTCACPDAAKRDKTVSMLITLGVTRDPTNKGKQAKRHVALLILGEIGRRASLSNIKQPKPVDVVLQQAFEDEDETVKVSAASSLGKLVVGDPKAFLPVVMSSLEKREGKRDYLLLVSLKEVVSSQSASSYIGEWLQVVLKVLKTHASDNNDEVRNMVAECLGRLAVLVPAAVVPELISAPTDSDSTKWTKITAMRYAIVSLSSCSPSLLDQAKHKIMDAFRPAVAIYMKTEGLEEKEKAEVCKAALQACHALVHHTPDLTISIFPNSDIVDNLFESTKVIPALQKKVDFGPFKVLVDDGLPLRKSSFSCLAALLENPQTQKLLGPLNTGKLIPCVVAGLGDSPEDHPDIPFLTHQILLQLCNCAPLSVLAHAQSILKGLQETLTKNKLDQKDQDPERKERKLSIVKSALRTVDHVMAIPGASEDRIVAETIQVIQKTEILKQLAIEEGLKNVFKKTGNVDKA